MARTNPEKYAAHYRRICEGSDHEFAKSGISIGLIVHRSSWILSGCKLCDADSHP
jgi:hypothetical protein